MPRHRLANHGVAGDNELGSRHTCSLRGRGAAGRRTILTDCREDREVSKGRNPPVCTVALVPAEVVAQRQSSGTATAKSSVFTSHLLEEREVRSNSLLWMPPSICKEFLSLRHVIECGNFCQGCSCSPIDAAGRDDDARIEARSLKVNSGLGDCFWLAQPGSCRSFAHTVQVFLTTRRSGFEEPRCRIRQRFRSPGRDSIHRASSSPRCRAPSCWPAPRRRPSEACVPAGAPARDLRGAMAERPADHGHRAGDQQTANVALAHLRGLPEPANRVVAACVSEHP